MDNKKYSMHNRTNRSGLDPIARLGIHPARAAFSIALLIVIGTLTACSAATSTTTTTSPTIAAPAASAPLATETSAPVTMATQPATAMPAATSALSQSTTQSITTTSLDPCVLIDSQAASTLTGVSFGQGVESTTPGGLKICTYGTSSANVFTVEVVQAPDVATAQSDKAQFLSDLQANLQQLTSQGLNVTQVPDFADGAVTANVNVSAGTLNLSGNAFAFLKNTVFVGFSDIALGGTAPTDTAMKAEATTVLGELP